MVPSHLTQEYSRILDDPNEKFDFFYKIIVIGDNEVGKSNFMLRVTQNAFRSKHATTYGVEFEYKTIDLPGGNKRLKA